VLAFVDVDQYIDMPHLLARNSQPVMIATVQPTVCAGNFDDFAFTFDEEGNIEYLVSGGARYVHPVWAYSVDTITCVAWWYFIPYAATTYLIDRRTTSPQHDVILLTPTGRWGFLATVMNLLLGYEPLRRFNLLRGTHNRLRVKTTEGLQVSTARPGQFACATVPVALDDTLANLGVVARTALTRAAVESHLPPATGADAIARNKETSTVLLDYHLHNSEKLSLLDYAASIARRASGGVLTLAKPMLAMPNKPTLRVFQFGRYVHDAKAAMEAYMSPLIDGAYAPAKTEGNEERAVKKRIVDVRSTAQATPFITGVVDEFLERLIPVPHLLHPHDPEEVELRQNRPTQAAKLHEADMTAVPKRVGKSFNKGEAYADVKDPRLITTYNSVDKVKYSQVMYAVSDWLKCIPAYAFSLSPAAVAQRVASLCTLAMTVCLTDFSRFDGTISPALRTFELALLFRLFAPEHHASIEELHRAQYNLFVVCSLGTRYELGTARGSGSPETSAFNSLCNMFATYLGHRMSPGSNCRYMTPDEAWERTMRGMYGGDDGLSPDIHVPSYVRATSALGLTVKAVNLNKGDWGVEFLARVYGPQVWYGDSANCADLPRQLSKLHVTPRRPDNVTNCQKLVDKMAGFALTDANTPILGPFAVKTMRLAAGVLDPDEAHMSYLARASWYEHEEPAVFDNPDRDWYSEYVDRCLPDFDHAKFTAWLDAAVTLDDLLSAPLCLEPKPPTVPDVPVVVDGELYTPSTQQPSGLRNPGMVQELQARRAGRGARGRGSGPRGSRGRGTRGNRVAGRTTRGGPAA
jgi:hypothetical protein